MKKKKTVSALASDENDISSHDNNYSPEDQSSHYEIAAAPSIPIKSTRLVSLEWLASLIGSPPYEMISTEMM
jgi:hypothetical protein